MIKIPFTIFTMIILTLWSSSVILYSLSYKKQYLSKIATFCVISGVLIFAYFLSTVWIKIGRPPMRTLGETRLWYSFFLPIVGLISYLRWKFKWFVCFSLFMAIMFLVLNYLNPDNFDKAIMPALQSPWFVPHVIMFIFSYSILAASAAVAGKGLFEYIITDNCNLKTLQLADTLVYIGFSLFTIAMLFGALWAKEAWGHYWTWDPKETWAFLAWMMYMLYIHFRKHRPKKTLISLWALFLAFLILLVCWFGVNYLPSTKNSIHVYSK